MQYYQADETKTADGRLFRSGIVFLSLVCAIYTAVQTANIGGQRFLHVFDRLGLCGIGVSIGLWCLLDSYRGIQEFRIPWRSRRWISLFFGSAYILSSIGSAQLAYYELVLKRPAPEPSWQDAFYLLAYLLMLCGILRMPQRRLPAARLTRVVLDSLITTVSLLTFSWYFVLGPTLFAGPGGMLRNIMAIAYPCGDLLMIFSLLFVSAHPSEKRLRNIVRITCVGGLLAVMSDTGAAYNVIHGFSTQGIPIDALLVTGFAFVGVSGMLARREPSEEETPEQGACHDVLDAEHLRPSWQAFAPYALAPTLGLLAFYVLRRHEGKLMTEGFFIAAAVLLTLVMTRQMLALAEHTARSRRLHGAYHELQRTHGALKEQNGKLADANKRLHRLATTDPLTGLANRRRFQERLNEEIHDASDTAPCALMLLDVDDFKAYNDTFGHPAGDRVLTEIALLLEVAAGDGLAARYGGEEFAVLLPRMGIEDARTKAEQIRRQVSSHRFPNRDITLSIGLTCIPDDRDTAAAWIAAADAALYSAKHGGRNRVVADTAGPFADLG
jgi:diguanylate cyclase (GGDEF)-like protein